MKKTLSLLGLFFVGLALLANPSIGILAAIGEVSPMAMVDAETTSAVSGDPPPESVHGEHVVAAETAAAETTAIAPVSDAAAQPGPYSVAGSIEESRWGDFQVEAVFEGGVLVDVLTL